MGIPAEVCWRRETTVYAKRNETNFTFTGQQISPLTRGEISHYQHERTGKFYRKWYKDHERGWDQRRSYLVQMWTFELVRCSQMDSFSPRVVLFGIVFLFLFHHTGSMCYICTPYSLENISLQCFNSFVFVARIDQNSTARMGMGEVCINPTAPCPTVNCDGCYACDCYSCLYLEPQFHPSILILLRFSTYFRTLGELWYEIFDIHTNMSFQQIQQFIDGEQQGIHYIIAMHPHGVIPFQGLIWAAFCNTYLRDGTGRSLYGFGAVADVVLSLPVLRTLMGWLACGGAGYSTLVKGLVEGKCESTNAVGRKPLHLFILPGGKDYYYLLL